MKRILVFSIMIVLGFAFIAAPAHAMGFSADVVTSSPQGSFTGKIYVDNDKIRMELPMAVTITRVDKKVAYMLMPAQRMYMEQPFDPKSAVATKEKLDGEVERTLVGTDTVDGASAKKYKVTYNSNGIKASVFQWMRDGLDIPVKTAAVDGSWAMEYRNLKTGDQPVELFEVPGDYQKFSMGNMAGMAQAMRNAAGAGD